MKLFARISKIDAAKREVWGRAVQEVPDRVREIFDYDSSKGHFQAWSDGFAKATADLAEPSLGNIRAMHGKVAAGKVIAIQFNDTEKAIDIGTKIVDDDEWKKCVEGVYTGFSIGGKYEKKWKDADDATLTRYTAGPSEISLVDLPCVPTAMFDIVKADGTSEKKPFQRYGLLKAAIGQDALPFGDLVALAVEYLPAESLEKKEHSVESVRAELRALLAETPVDALEKTAAPAAQKIAARDDTTPKEGEDKYGDVKFADPKNKKYPIDTEQHIRAAWNYINKQKNAAKYSAEDVKTIKDRIIAAWKDKISSDGPPSADDTEKFLAATLAKGMYQVSMLADIVQSIYYLAMDAQYEAEWEQDGSLMPEQLKAWLQLGVEIVKDMAEEESQELIAQLNALMDPAVAQAVLALAAKGGLTKAGKRHSKADEDKIQAIHDHSSALGAMCPSEGGDSEKIAKAASERAALEKRLADAEAAHATELAKAQGEAKAAIEQSVSLTKQLGEVTTVRDGLAGQVDALKKVAAVGKGVTSTAVTKIADAATGDDTPDATPKTPIELIKAVHAAGGRPLRP